MLFFILLSKQSFCQQEQATIKGYVFHENGSVVIGAKMIMWYKDSVKHTTFTNQNGEYSFNIYHLKEVVTLTYEINGKRPKPRPTSNSCYLGIGDGVTRHFFITKPDTIVIADFMIRKDPVVIVMPEMNFKENSSDFETNSLIASNKPNATIDSLLKILKQNPTIELEIGGHCDIKENNKEKLSVKRAEVIKEILVKKGIDGERLELKFYEDKQLVVSEEDIIKTKSSKESTISRGKNRRASFKLLSFDYEKK